MCSSLLDLTNPKETIERKAPLLCIIIIKVVDKTNLDFRNGMSRGGVAREGVAAQ